MKNKHLRATSVLLAIAVAAQLCGCESIEPTKETTTQTTTTEQTTVATTTTTVQTTTTPATTPKETLTTSVSEIDTDGLVEEYSTYTFTDEYNEFLDKLVFVGDSICSGIGLYDLVKSSNMLAKGNVAARSIMDYTFKVNGKEYNIVKALEKKQPEYVAFFMGMNDVNMTTAETYAENYRKILTDVQEVCPDSTLIIISTSPISVTSKFTKNEYIDEQNKAACEMVAENSSETNKWLYIDVTKELKNSANGMKTLYQSDDGVHVIKGGFEAILWSICHQMLDEPDPEQPENPVTTKNPDADNEVTTRPYDESEVLIADNSVTTAPEEN